MIEYKKITKAIRDPSDSEITDYMQELSLDNWDVFYFSEKIIDEWRTYSEEHKIVEYTIYIKRYGTN